MSTDSRRQSESSGSIHSTLLQQVGNRDAGAWRRLVQTIGPLVYDWCRGQGLQAADAGDVVQETFRAVLGGLDNFRRERPGDSFRGWLWTITRSKIADHYRARGRQADALGGTDAWQQLQAIPETEPDDPSESSLTTNSPLYRALKLVQSDFGETTWRAFWRVTVDQQRSDLVAEEMGLTVNAVRKAKARVLQRLREEFGELLD